MFHYNKNYRTKRIYLEELFMMKARKDYNIA